MKKKTKTNRGIAVAVAVDEMKFSFLNQGLSPKSKVCN